MTGGPFDDIAAALDEVSAVTIRAAVDEFHQLALGEAARTPWRRRMTTRVDRVTAGNDQATARVVGTPAGNWAWAEAGIHPHTIARRRAKARRRGRGNPAVLALAGGNLVVGPVHHPGRPGVRAWSRATEALEDRLADIALDALDARGL